MALRFEGPRLTFACESEGPDSRPDSIAHYSGDRSNGREWCS
jgi:hypothetical protein